MKDRITLTLHSIGLEVKTLDFPALRPAYTACARRLISSTGSSCFYLSSPPLQKYFASHSPQIIFITLAIPSRERGVSRSSRTLGAGCGGRGSVLRARDRRADFFESVSDALSARTRDAAGVRSNRVVLTPRRWRQVLRRHVGPTGRGYSIFARRRWQKSPVTGKSTTYAVKTIACGNAGRFRCTRRYSCASTTTKRARGCGCSGHPAFPTPSISRARGSSTTRARFASRERMCLWSSSSLRAKRPILRHSGAMPTAPREARPDDRLRIEPGILGFPDAQIAHLRSGPEPVIGRRKARWDHPGMTAMVYALFEN
jgi:hypothetical protein